MCDATLCVRQASRAWMRILRASRTSLTSHFQSALLSLSRENQQFLLSTVNASNWLQIKGSLRLTHDVRIFVFNSSKQWFAKWTCKNGEYGFCVVTGEKMMKKCSILHLYIYTRHGWSEWFSNDRQVWWLAEDQIIVAYCTSRPFSSHRHLFSICLILLMFM